MKFREIEFENVEPNYRLQDDTILSFSFGDILIKIGHKGKTYSVTIRYTDIKEHIHSRLHTIIDSENFRNEEKALKYANEEFSRILNERIDFISTMSI